MLEIRLEGFADNVARAARELHEIFHVRTESPDRVNRPPSRFVRRYLSVELSQPHHRTSQDETAALIRWIADPSTWMMHKGTLDICRLCGRAARNGGAIRHEGRCGVPHAIALERQLEQRLRVGVDPAFDDGHVVVIEVDGHA